MYICRWMYLKLSNCVNKLIRINQKFRLINIYEEKKYLMRIIVLTKNKFKVFCKISKKFQTPMHLT